MKYSENVAARAERELEARRTAAEEQQQVREQKVMEKIPEIGVLRRQQRESYFELIKLVASHSDNAAEKAAALREKSLAAQESIAVMVENLTGDRGYLDIKYTCPKCHDTGYVEGVRCECLEELLKKYSLEELNSNSSITLHDFSEFCEDYYLDDDIRERMVKNRNMFVKYCANFSKKPPSFLFIGETGLGKTFFSACIVKDLGERGIPAAFMSAFDMLRTLENEYFGRAEGDTMDHLLSAPLLVIDDLGAEPAVSKFNESFLYNIINGRINRALPTIISTNLSVEEIKERYGDRIASRMLNDYMTVRFRGTDIRQQKVAERNRRFKSG